MAKVKVPADYPFPPHEVGVAAIPPTEFYTDENAHLAEDYIRFAVCKEDAVLEEAKNKLRGLKKYMTE
ncbi:hypothetical protein NLG97_g9974 [Lecanicillium saksenae]|uniref:Uncharacterized protein n=1 Tax=Lecanicillium saksenae TaxID=468837 RepID=A0ACC1QFT0_9HYPO|nr:hypothetical protein NLG97_g9974 [Lecanicillium saksenae]